MKGLELRPHTLEYSIELSRKDVNNEILRNWILGDGSFTASISQWIEYQESKKIVLNLHALLPQEDFRSSAGG